VEWTGVPSKLSGLGGVADGFFSFPHCWTIQLIPSVLGLVPGGICSRPKLSSKVIDTSCGIVLGARQPGGSCDQG
jgi:hypothetical protein